jgi:Na+/proline symporter
MFWEQIGFGVFIGAYLTLSMITTLHAGVKCKRAAAVKSTNKVASHSTKTAADITKQPVEAAAEAESEHQSEYTEYARKAINYSAGFNSAFLIVGSLSEAYLYGVRMVGNIISVFLGFVYAMALVQPFMYSLDASLTTPYHYFAKRYRDSRWVRAISAFGGLLYHFLFLSLFLWGGTVLLSTVIPYIPLYASSILIGLVSIIGASVGGGDGFIQSTKVNVFQFVILIAGLVSAICFSIVKNRHEMSVDEMIELATENNRTVFFDTTVDLNTRYTILNQVTSLSLVISILKLVLFLTSI